MKNSPNCHHRRQSAIGPIQKRGRLFHAAALPPRPLALVRGPRTRRRPPRPRREPVVDGGARRRRMEARVGRRRRRRADHVRYARVHLAFQLVELGVG